MDNFIYIKVDKNHTSFNNIKKALTVQNAGILMFVFVIWDKKLLLTEPSHLRATRQGIEEVKKHKAGKSHRCGSGSYAAFWVLESTPKNQGLV